MTTLDIQEHEWARDALVAAKLSIKKSDRQLKRAIEEMIDAEAFGATEDQIAEAVGRPVEWVRRQLKQQDLKTIRTS